MYKHIEALTTNSFVNKETDTRDLIFNNTPSPTDTIVSKLDDPEYGKTDYSLYYFSTMGDDVHVIHSNNMVIPIRKKTAINTYRAYDKLINGLGIDKPENGIYIVEYYNLYINNRTQGDKILDLYLTSDNIEYTDKVIEDIVNEIKASKGRRGVYNNVNIRIITFVPETVLKDKHYIYVKGPNLLLTYGEIDNSVCHPKSSLYTSNKTKDTLLSEDVDNVILIDIVNNDDNSPYYIKVGNAVHKIYPNKSSEKSEGICVSTKRNGVVINDVTVDLKDHKEVGIYRTRDECITNGDVKLLLEQESLKHEKDKLEFEYEKLKNSYEKLKIEKESMISKQEHERRMNEVKLSMAKLDQVKKERDHILDKENKIFELDLKVANAMLDMEHRAIKNKFELEKLDMDIRKAKIEGNIKNIGNLTSIIKGFTK